MAREPKVTPVPQQPDAPPPGWQQNVQKGWPSRPKFSRGDRVRISEKDAVVPHFRGCLGTVETVEPMGSNYVYTVRLDQPVGGMIIANTLFEDWLDVEGKRSSPPR